MGEATAGDEAAASAAVFFLRPASLRPIQATGSYEASTTRSFNGMMALSVILMCSGQTSVQHLVMLHMPMPIRWRRSSRRSFVSRGWLSSSM